MFRSRLVAALAATALTLVGCAASSTSTEPDTGVPSTLRVGIIPNIAPEKQQAKYEPFAEYLGAKLGTKVELFVASDYAGVVAALVGGRIDMAYLGGLTYVQGDRQVPLTPLVTEIDATTGTEKYESAVVVKSDSAIKSLALDVVAKGGSFAFGDPASTSGSLYPRQMITEAGARCDVLDLTSCPPLSRVLFTGGHDATAKAVLSGSVDAGGLELRVLRRLEKDGTIPSGSLRVIETRLVQGYPWVMRTELGAKAQQQLTDLFLSITDPALLDLLRAKRYVAVTSSDYDDLRGVATTLGLLKE